jgi:hypothetical protein
MLLECKEATGDFGSSRSLLKPIGRDPVEINSYVTRGSLTGARRGGSTMCWIVLRYQAGVLAGGMACGLFVRFGIILLC